VSVHAGVTSGPSQRLVVLVWNVLSCLRVFVPLSQAEVYHVHYVLLLIDPHQEIIGLHISMDEVVIV